MWLANLEYANRSLEDKCNWNIMLVIKTWMIGTSMLKEEIMHTRVGDAKGHSQGSYTMSGDGSMALDQPCRIKYVVEQKFLGGIGH